MAREVRNPDSDGDGSGERDEDDGPHVLGELENAWRGAGRHSFEAANPDLVKMEIAPLQKALNQSSARCAHLHERVPGKHRRAMVRRDQIREQALINCLRRPAIASDRYDRCAGRVARKAERDKRTELCRRETKRRKKRPNATPVNPMVSERMPAAA